MKYSNAKLLYLITLSVCLQRLSIALANILLGIAIAMGIYGYYHKQFSVRQLASFYRPYYKAYAFLLLCFLPSVLFAGELPVSIKQFAEIWLYRAFPFFVLPLLQVETKVGRCLYWLVAYIALDGAVAAGQMLLAADVNVRAMGMGDGWLRFASILVTVYPLTLIGLLDSKLKFKGQGYLALMALTIIAGAVAVQSRGAWVVIGVTTALILFRYLWQRPKAVLATILVLGIIVAGCAQVPHLVDRFTSITNVTTDRSNGDRVEGWKSGWEMLKAKPLVGWGIDQSNQPYREHYRSKAETQGLNHFHNNFVEIAVDTGVIGIFGYVCLVLFVLLKNWQWKNPYSFMLFCSWVAFQSFGMIEYNIDLSASAKVLWFVLASLLILQQHYLQQAAAELPESQKAEL